MNSRTRNRGRDHELHDAVAAGQRCQSGVAGHEVQQGTLERTRAQMSNVRMCADKGAGLCEGEPWPSPLSGVWRSKDANNYRSDAESQRQQRSGVWLQNTENMEVLLDRARSTLETLPIGEHQRKLLTLAILRRDRVLLTELLREKSANA